MSLVSRALGVEKRAVSTYTGPTFPSGLPGEAVDLASYGVPGAGYWGAGMQWVGGYGGASADQAMKLSAVFACWRILSEPIATLPLDVFRREADGERTAVEKPEYLRFEPPGLPRTSYLSQVMMSLVTDGNAFVATPRGPGLEVRGLIPLDPARVNPVVIGDRLVYEALGQHWSTLDVMHIPGMMFPGALRGISPLRAQREVIESGLAAQSYGGSMFANHAVPPAVIEVPAPVDGARPVDETARAQEIADAWHRTHGGTANAGKVGVLIGGARLNTVAISPEDAQWLDSKRFGVSEIARFYGVPPHLIADASNSTSWGSGLAEQNTAFGSFSLRPWVTRIEEAHDRLIYTDNRRGEFTKLNLDAGLRSATRDRYDAYAVAIEHDFLTINEARALEDLPRVEWGDLAWSSIKALNPSAPNPFVTAPSTNGSNRRSPVDAV